MHSIDLLGEDAVFHHVGLAVASITDAADKADGLTSDLLQGVNVAFVEIGGVKVELIEPQGPDSPVSADLKNGRKLVHLCFGVPDIERAVRHARRHGLHSISKPVPAPAFGGRRIAWLYSTTYGLIELLES